MKESPMDHLSDELLSEQIDGQLDAATTARVQAHLADCAACAARYAGLQEVRVALQTLRQVSDIPDFRLTQQGKPRRSSSTHAVPPVRRPPAFIGALPYGISSAALVLGVVLLLVAGFTGLSMLPHHQAADASTAAAEQSNSGCVNQAKCPSTQHPGAGGTSTVAANRPTPTVVIATSSTQTQTGTSVGTESGGSSNPVPVEAGLGLVLVIGGAVGLRRFSGQRR